MLQVSGKNQFPYFQICNIIITLPYKAFINLLQPKAYFMYRHLQHTEILCSTHNAFMRFAWISEQTAIISLYSINLSVFITKTESVYCAVQTGSLNQTDTVSFLKG